MRDQMDLFQRLLAMRQLQFKEGEIDLLGQRIVMSPRDTLVGVTEFLTKNPELVPGMYETIRCSFGSGWASAVKKSYGFSTKDYIKWLIDISNIAGWGKSELVKYDIDTDIGVFRTFNPLIGSQFIGKSTVPVDHIWRALTAGGQTRVFDKEMDWIETQCVATGSPFCEFVFKPRKSITLAEREKYPGQLPV